MIYLGCPGNRYYLKCGGYSELDKRVYSPWTDEFAILNASLALTDRELTELATQIEALDCNVDAPNYKTAKYTSFLTTDAKVVLCDKSSAEPYTTTVRCCVYVFRSDKIKPQVQCPRIFLGCALARVAWPEHELKCCVPLQ